MSSKLKTLTYAAALLMGASAYAEDTAKIHDAAFIEEVGGSERINFSGKLRMLSQRIPAAACYAHASIEKDASSKLLEAATAEFDLILNGLEFGEEKLGIIGPEGDRKVLYDIHELHAHWDYLHPEIEDIMLTGGTDEEVLHIAAESHEILSFAKHLVNEVVREYADPTALLQADAMVIDIAGRQRMLAQRVSKNICLISSGFDTQTALKELEGASGIFAATTDALRFGMPAAGVRATENEEILTGLDSVFTLWTETKPLIDLTLAGEDLDEAQLAKVYNAMNSLTGQMNTIVGMYNDDSKLGL